MRNPALPGNPPEYAEIVEPRGRIAVRGKNGQAECRYPLRRKGMSAHALVIACNFRDGEPCVSAQSFQPVIPHALPGDAIRRLLIEIRIEYELNGRT